MEKSYITTTLPYVNSDPHLGFAMEIVRADVLARTMRKLGHEVWFNTGTDEHGQKIYQKAKELGIDPKEYCDQLAVRFKQLKQDLDLSWDSFIRTTDQSHIEAAQEFWNRCLEQGDIYKKNYKTKYCVGCELEKTDSDLVDGKCPDHPNKDLEIREEENYFFRFSKYQEKLLKLYKDNPSFVSPDFRQKEITNFVESGLTDFSISRLKTKMPWGVEVPGDPGHVMYVWFDALVNYISVLGWPKSKDFENWWPGVQVCGKDNLRQQSAMWQAMLMSAGIANTKKIFVNGFILSNNQKMSKTLGNVIDPLEWVKKYGTEPVRYFLLSALSTFEDSDVTEERFREVYKADLAEKGIGNVLSRIAKLASMTNKKYFIRNYNITDVFFQDLVKDILNYRFDTAVSSAMSHIRHLEHKIALEEPWKHKNNIDKLESLVDSYLDSLARFNAAIEPFMPELSSKINKHFGFGLSQGKIIEVISPLYPSLK